MRAIVTILVHVGPSVQYVFADSLKNGILQPMSELVLARRVYFCCAYQDNDKLQGHNYCLEAFFSGPMDAKSGLVVNLSDIDPILKQAVDELDHKHLNHEVAYFKTTAPEIKSILTFCEKKIQALLSQDSPARLIHLKLNQGEDHWAELRTL